MSAYGMIIDVGRCVGCYNCFLACRDEHVGNDHRPYAVPQPESGHRWIDIQVQEFGGGPRVRVTHTPLPCLQCQNAHCIEAGQGAITRRADGIVLIDPEKAAGRRDLVAACPYGVIYWNEAANTAQKCTFCAHLLDRGWSQPRCAEVCPTQAILFGDLDDPASDIARQAAAGALEELRPQLNSGARVRYRHLPAPFLSGEVVLADQPDLPAPGVRIELDDGSRRFETRSDNYGEFRFPAIKPRQRYRVRIEHPGYASLEISVAPHAPKDLGALMLQRGGP